MAFIFLDESGDLGFDFFKKKTTKYFIITLLFATAKKPIEKVVKKTYLGLSRTYKHKINSLHANKEKPVTKNRMLSSLSEKDISVMVIYLNKNKVYTKLQNQKEVLYNYVTNILLDRVYTKKLIPIDKEIHLIASRKETNKFLNQNFKEYLSGQIKNNFRLELKIEIKTPAEEKSLQAVDFISWAVFRKYEYGDESYYDLIKSKIVEENGLFV